MYPKKLLQNNFENAAEGKSPEEFLREKTEMLLKLWIENDTGSGLYKNTGPFWETLYEILRKYQPELLSDYSRIVGDFSYFNDEIKSEYDYGRDELNFMAALQYMNDWMNSYHSSNEVHLVELNGEEIPYMPNQNIDTDQYFGRE